MFLLLHLTYLKLLLPKNRTLSGEPAEYSAGSKPKLRPLFRRRLLQSRTEVQTEHLRFVIIFLNNRESQININLSHRRLPCKAKTGGNTRTGRIFYDSAVNIVR